MAKNLSADRSAQKAEIAAKTSEVKSCQWWRASKVGKKPHEMLHSLVSHIREDQSERYESYKEWARALGQDMSSISGEIHKIWDNKLTINELQNTIETLHAQIFKNKVVPAPCPSESDYEQFFRAMGFGRWIEGILDDIRVFYDVVPQVGLAALAWGTGCAKVYEKTVKSEGGTISGKIIVEPVSPLNLYVDRLEARHGRPRSLHQKMHIDRWVALEKWGDTPEKQLAIIDAKQLDGEDFDLADLGDGDQITIWQSWHLDSGSGEDGFEAVWIKNCTLDEGPYNDPTFPFVFLKFGVPLSGFWGLSAVQRLLPAQKAYDKLTDRIDTAHDLLGIPRLIKRPGSIQSAQLDDVPGSVIEVEDPGAVKEWNPVPITPDAYRERDSLPQRMRGSIGISGFEAQLQLPQQLREASGAAMERWIDVGNARHAMFHSQYEEFMIQLTHAILRCAVRLEEKGVDVVAKAPGPMRSTVEMLKFSQVKMDMDKLKLRVLPVNQLPRTFAGRVKDLGALRDRGDITQKTYLRLLEIPDIESEIDNYVSDEDIIRKNLDYMVRTKKYLNPLPYDNHDLIVKLTARKIHEVRIRIEDEEEQNEVVNLLIQYIEDTLAIQNGLQDTSSLAPAPGQPPVGPSGPMLGPNAVPTQAFGPMGPPQVPPAQDGGTALPPPPPGQSPPQIQ